MPINIDNLAKSLFEPFCISINVHVHIVTTIQGLR